MIGEREDFNHETHYGALKMRSYDINGNVIDAFYDSSDNLVFVLDNTINAQKPNVLLVINPNADKKWDEILSTDYGVDLETIRPKVDNKYQKFDIEYSGLSVYDALIHAFDAGDSLEDALNQLTILRDSAARHSAMTRLNVANETITKTNATIVKTQESIVRLNARLKTLRAKLAEAKKSIGREPTKQSASKILKLESQIDATNEKIKRANERLKSARRRLETATVDAELASALLNQPGGEIKQTVKKVKPVAMPVEKRSAPVAVEEPTEEIEETVTTEETADDDADDFEEYTEESTVEEEIQNTEPENEKIKPLFNEDPQILNDDIAFKPISFNAQKDSDKPGQEAMVPDLSKEMLLTEETDEQEIKEIEDFSDQEQKSEPVVKEEEIVKDPVKIEEEKPMLDSMLPVPTDSESTAETEPVTEEKSEDKDQSYNMPEFTSFIEPVEEVSEFTKEESSLPETLDEDMRQPEPVYDQKSPELNNLNMNEPVMPPAPVMPAAPVMPQSASKIGNVYDVESKRKPSLLYYLFLIILIVLAVFTLWLYQRSVDPTRPVVAQNIERVENNNKNSVLKKQPGARKPFKIKIEDKKKEELNIPTFLDEKPTKVKEPVEEVEVVVEKKPKIKEVIEEEVIVETVKKEPEIMGAVPARVNSSGKAEDQQKKVLSEEDILAAKPAFQPGSKYDEMFITGEDAPADDSFTEYVDEEPQYIPDDNEELLEYEYIDDVSDPYYDAEEMEYQAEYNGGMFEE